MVDADILECRSILDRFRGLESRIPTLERGALRQVIAETAAELRRNRGAKNHTVAIDAALKVCRTLYEHARSAEALLLARAALDEARDCGDSTLTRRVATVCGLLAADSLDLVAAIEYYVIALRVAMAAGDAGASSGIWNNVGLAMGISGHHELAARCYQRSVELVADVAGPVSTRYVARLNLALCLLRAGAPADGLPHAFLALEEETPELQKRDPLSVLFLRRNLVRLLVACGRTEEAAPYVKSCTALAEQIPNPRSAIAVATTLGTYELALGKTDVALTRLDKALMRARQVPAALHDTLVTLIRAEESAGNIGRALIRLEELTQHVYRNAVERAHEHVELSALYPASAARMETNQRHAKARLAALTEPPAVPEAWAALDRLAVSAVMRMDDTGWHGKRVGALVKGLSLAIGCDPLQSLEMGLAAELHDIGMLSIPEGVLTKSGSLNDAERAIVRRHVDAGVEMLRDDRHPRVFVAREMAQYHHARWDGEGHPAIGGKQIPLAARACAVADAYDAMVCGLGTGKPLAMDHALSELRREAGGQFDPELVRSFENFICTESEDLGVDFASSPGMESFQSLVHALREDRGFV